MFSKSVSITNRMAHPIRLLPGEFQNNIQEHCVPIRRSGTHLGKPRVPPLRDSRLPASGALAFDFASHPELRGTCFFFAFFFDVCHRRSYLLILSLISFGTCRAIP